MHVVVQSTTFAQKLRGEQQDHAGMALGHRLSEPHRHSGLYHHNRVRILGSNLFNNRLDS